MEIVKADELTVKLNGKTIINKLSFVVKQGEQWVITGPSGSGKTTLLQTLAGKIFHSGSVIIHAENSLGNKKVVLVDQQHHFKNLSNTSNFYYQQRFNSSDAEDSITVEEDLKKAAAKTHADAETVEHLATSFNIKKLYTERLLQLSNGENKRLQIVKALLLQPAILLLDNPFTGLDVDSRTTLEEVLEQVLQKGVHIITTASASHVPRFVTNVLSLAIDGSYKMSSKDNYVFHTHWQEHFIDHQLLQELCSTNTNAPFSYAVKMNNVTITYDGKKILDNINWQVKNGERWSLSGPNGSGKSTLLSLINADNPQAYANDIYFFDSKRGTGESIWDIKKNIGYVSPELHLYFEKGITCHHVVASGLFDTIGLFRKINQQQTLLAHKWLQLLHLDHLSNKFLFQLSNSEQRLVLLARALIKNPPLLILDEPCQGLDDEQVQLFKILVDKICIASNKTLIYVSHYTNEIPQCVNKLIQLKQGRVADLH